MLLFADDIVLFTTDPSSLQTQLNNVQQYSSKWGLKINTGKTKVCIFENRKCNSDFRWTINQEQLEVVDSFCYLGIKFYYTGNMIYAAKALQ